MWRRSMLRLSSKYLNLVLWMEKRNVASRFFEQFEQVRIKTDHLSVARAQGRRLVSVYDPKRLRRPGPWLYFVACPGFEHGFEPWTWPYEAKHPFDPNDLKFIRLMMSSLLSDMYYFLSYPVDDVISPTIRNWGSMKTYYFVFPWFHYCSFPKKN